MITKDTDYRYYCIVQGSLPACSDTASTKYKCNLGDTCENTVLGIKQIMN